MRKRPIRLRWLVGLLAVLACAHAFAQARLSGAEEAARAIEDNWYALYVSGQKSGYQHEQVFEKQAADGVVYETRLHQEFALARAGSPMRFVLDTAIREDETGRLVAFRHRVRGPMSRVVQGKVSEGELVLRTRTDRASDTTRVPAHDGLCPWALRRLQEERMGEPGLSYSARAFLPDVPGQAVEINVTIAGREEVDVFEVKKRLQRIDTTISILPGLTSSEWVDDSGTIWLIRANLPGNLALESRKATQITATAPDDPADILAASFVEVDRPIPNARNLRRLRLLLERLEGGSEDLHIPSGPFQEVEAAADGLLITTRRAEGSPALSYTLPYSGAEHAAMVRPNVWMETEDPLVAELSRAAVGNETDALAAARLIEEYVRDFITAKNLSLGMATAAEAAAQKAGDCTEHAVLAAALARAAGIPSRVVGGLVYVDTLPGVETGGFGYHMWTEVYVGEWLPLDAALGSHDATHLAIVRSDLNGPDDLFTLSAAISQLFGGVRVRVLEAE